MKASRLITQIGVGLVLVLLVLGLSQPEAAGEKPKDAVTPTLAQQKPIVLLIRERELLNARLEGAVESLMACLELNPAEWEAVTDGGNGIRFVRRKPPVSAPIPPSPEGEKK